MKYLLIVLALFALGTLPASALNGYPPYYWVVYGNSYPREIVAGPYDNDYGQNNAWSKCQYVQQVYARNDPSNAYLYNCVMQ
jgi:hypothetical protein